MKKNLTFFGFLLAMGLFAMSCNNLKPDNKPNTKQKLQNIVKEIEQLEKELEKETENYLGLTEPSEEDAHMFKSLVDDLNLEFLSKAIFKIDEEALKAEESVGEYGNKAKKEKLKKCIQSAQKISAIITELDKKDEELKTVHQ